MKPTVLLAGMCVGQPGQGGATSAVLQWVSGLQALGFHVVLVEPIPTDDELAVNGPIVRYLRRLLTDGDLRCETVLLTPGRNTVGMTWSQLTRVADSAVALLNIGGMLREAELCERIPIRVYLDLDPAFTQLWQRVSGLDMGFAGHTHFVTLGTNIGQPSCRVPTCERVWITTLPPVDVKDWAPLQETTLDAFTTVANWRSYGSINHDGELYGQKAHSFRRLLILPRLIQERILPVLAIDDGDVADISALQANGWSWLNPAENLTTPAAYRAFIRGAKAELAVAKSGYVRSPCGWFSERSAAFLAAGRPVVAQRTGFEAILPMGEGLLGFDDVEEAAAGIAEVAADYARHRKAARAIAEEYLSAGVVLDALCRKVGLC